MSDVAEQDPVTSKEEYALELDRTEVSSLSHLKLTAPGFVCERTETPSSGRSRLADLVPTKVR